MGCKNCGKELCRQNKTGLCRGCSCRDPEIRKKNSEGVKKAFSEGKMVYNGSETNRLALLKGSQQYTKNCASEIENNPNRYYKGERLKNYLLVHGRDYRCEGENCGIVDWNKKYITLEVDHIDGNNNNNSLKNLRFLCPNCHSQTDTYKGKNKKGISIKEQIFNAVPKEDILKAYNETGNIRRALMAVGLSPTGANYGRVYDIVLESKRGD